MSSASTGPRTPALQTGETVGGKYRVVRLLGEGGMGAVYLVQHQSLGSQCALKVLSRGSALHHARFGREARILASLRSEHVAKVVDFGFIDALDAPYMVMEYLPGVDLSQHLDARAEPLPVRDAVDHVLEACEALAEAHRAGIIHRDVKPSNLFLTTRFDGSPMVKVLDFGIAKTESAPGDDASLTATTMVFGSPAYMSPEQVRSSKLVGPQTDIWSLALVLYELVSKGHPFHGDSTAGIVAAIAADAPTPLPAWIGPGLWDVLEPALRKDPRERPQTIAAFAVAIARFGSERGRIVLPRLDRLAGHVETPADARERTQALLGPPAASASSVSGTPIVAAADGLPPASARTTYGGRSSTRSGRASALPFVLAGFAIVAFGTWVGMRSLGSTSSTRSDPPPSPPTAAASAAPAPRAPPSAAAPATSLAPHVGTTPSAAASAEPSPPAPNAAMRGGERKKRPATATTPTASGGTTPATPPRQGEFN